MNDLSIVILGLGPRIQIYTMAFEMLDPRGKPEDDYLRDKSGYDYLSGSALRENQQHGAIRSWR